MRIAKISLISGALAVSLAGIAHGAAPVLGGAVSISMQGDANGDGVANALDLQIVQKNMGKPGTWIQGDFDGNGIVNSNDLTILNNNFARKLPPVYFGKIADTSTPVPLGSGNFSIVNPPTVDSSGNMAFEANGTSNLGIYKWSAGTLTRIADNNTTIPNTGEQFANFGQPSIAAGKIVFDGFGNTKEGLYSSVNGSLTLLFDKSTPRPEGGNFSSLSDPALVNTSVSFIGTAGTIAGAYSLTGSTVTPVVSTTTPIPGGTGNFKFLSNVVSDGTNTWFIGRGTSPSQFGIYKKTGNVITTLLNRDTVINGTSAQFTGGGNLSLDGQNLSFTGKLGGIQGVFDIIGNSINRIADTSTAIPGGKGQFVSFGMSSIGGSSVAFVGYGANSTPGIYTWINGGLERVIDSSVILNGKTITDFGLSRDAVVDNKVVFQVLFNDHSTGIFSASLLAKPVTGDVNNDGVVNRTDLAILEAGLGKPGSRSAGDLNGDGLINVSDFQILESNFGKTGTPALLGDTDGNGIVDRADLSVFFANNGKYGSAAQGDFNGDGKINMLDFQYLEMNYGKTAPLFSPFGSAAAADVPGSVPEPTGLVLGIAGLAIMARRGRRN